MQTNTRKSLKNRRSEGIWGLCVTLSKRILSTFLCITFLTTTIIAALPQMITTVYAADPVVKLGSEALKTNAGQSGAQKVFYGGRSWVVIAYKGKNGSGTDLGLYPDGSITLLQDKVTETSKFNNDYSHTNSNAYGYMTYTSETENTPSDLRKFIEEKYLTASSPYINAKEQDIIVSRTLAGGGGSYNTPEYNENNMKGHEVSNAKVWPLSVAEVNKVDSSIRAFDKSASGSNYWWLRSPGILDSYAAYVYYNGNVDCSGLSVHNLVGVRPALLLNPSSIILTSRTDDGYRLVAQTDDISVSVTKSGITRDGTTVTVPYTVTGDYSKAYILITDKAYDASGATIKLYKELTAAGDGKGSFTLPDSFDSSWKAYIIAEDTSAGNTHADMAGISAAFTIPDASKPTLTITAKDKTYQYNGQYQGPGDAAYEDSDEIAEMVTVEGLQSGDTLTSITVDGQGKEVGDYDLLPSAAWVNNSSASDKYDVTYVKGTLHITSDEISYTVKFKVKNGRWNDGSKDDVTVILTGNAGDTLKLSADQIPAVGSKPDDNYKEGNWDTTPSTETAITKDTTYTYTYAPESAKTYTVTVTDDGHGSAKSNPKAGTTGTKVTIKATPDRGYQFREWEVISGGVELADKKKASTTFKIKDSDVEVKAIFEKKEKHEDDDDDDHHEEPAKPAVVNPDTVEGYYAVNGQPVPGVSMGKMAQGPAAQALLNAKRSPGWIQAYTFNMAINGKPDYTLKNGTLCILIPKDLQKAGRTFAIMAIDKNARVLTFPDIDTNPATVTANISFEGYAFALIYKD